MKKILLLACILSSLWVTFATVGWPTIIDDLYYDKSQNTILYSKTFYDGLGWSEIHQYSINNSKDIVLTEIKGLVFEENRLWDLTGLQEYCKKQGFIPLKEFQLDKIPVTISLTIDYFNQLSNNESFEINKVQPYIFTENPENYMMSGYIMNFIWTNKIYLNNQLRSEIKISTCRLDPINYRWFGLEDADTIAIIASSEKKDCMEWGYVWEDIQIITGVQIDKSNLLPYKSVIIDNANQKLLPSTWGLLITPKLTGENKIYWTIERDQKSWLWDRIKAYINKIFSYIK